jgi:hypothetical protein
VIGGDSFFTSRIEQLAALTVHYAVPAIHAYREFRLFPRREMTALVDLPIADIAYLFDHLIGGVQQAVRYVEAERLGGLEVDDKLVLGRRLHRQVGGFLALENPAGVDAG